MHDRAKKARHRTNIMIDVEKATQDCLNRYVNSKTFSGYFSSVPIKPEHAMYHPVHNASLCRSGAIIETSATFSYPTNRMYDNSLAR